MVMLAIEFHQFRLKVDTDASEDAAQVINHFLGKYATAIFRHKDQVNVHLENAMPAVSHFVVISIDRVKSAT